MTDLYISITQASSRINSLAIDGAGTVGDDSLKSLCIVSQGGNETIAALSATYTEATAVRASLVQRASGDYDSHLLVSPDIFAVLKAALQLNEKLRFKITDHGDTSGTFKCRKVLPLEEGEPVQRIAETLTRLDERVERIEGDIDAIRQILQTDGGSRGAGATKLTVPSNGTSSKRQDYVSVDGQEKRPS